MALQRQPRSDRLFLMGGISLVIHIALAVFLNLNPWPTIMRVPPTVYTVTLMPVTIPEPEVPKPAAPLVPKVEKTKPVERVKPIEKPKKDDIVEKVKQPPKKSTKDLHEALEEIRKKAALDEIRKKVALREREEERPTAIPSTMTSMEMESKLNEYYSLLWAKIKREWTIPENLIKEKELVDLEAIIVIIIEGDGKIQRGWFEKKSGNPLYDQSAMRAVKKAEPMPPIPKELSKERLELGIRFRPD